MKELQRLRERQTTSTPKILLMSLPVGVLYTALTLEYWIAAAVAGAAFIALVATVGRKANRTDIAITDYQDGDYPMHQVWLPFVPLAVSLIAGPAIDNLAASASESPTLTVVGAVGYSALLTLSLAFGWRATERRPYRIGTRRIKKILSTDDKLDQVTVGNLELVDKHRWLVRVLVSMGAIDGAEAEAWKVAELADTDSDTVRAAARELQAQKLVKIGAFADGGKAHNYRMWLTPAGVRVAAEAEHR